jgi:hypothetical protein
VFLWFIYFFIHMCIHRLGHFFPPAPCSLPHVLCFKCFSVPEALILREGDMRLERVYCPKKGNVMIFILTAKNSLNLFHKGILGKPYISPVDYS